jgi:hypothetical protein
MKTYESKTYLVFIYCPIATIILQQLPSCNNYCHTLVIIMHILSFIDLKKDPQLLVDL